MDWKKDCRIIIKIVTNRCLQLIAADDLENEDE
jgi:hypothetical protein